MPRRSWQYRTSVALLPLSAALYAISLFMQVFSIERNFQILGMVRADQESFRLFGAIEDLWQEGEIVLALIVTAFSFVFPVGKYLALAFVVRARSERGRARVLNWVKNLGQWSMGDVFVVAMLVVIVRVDNGIAQIGVKPLAGLWVFTSSVITAMVVSALLAFEPRPPVSAAPAERQPATQDSHAPHRAV